MLNSSEIVPCSRKTNTNHICCLYRQIERMEFLINLDHELFLFINRSLSNTFFDVILPLVRNRYIWVPVYIAIIAYIFTKFDLHKASYYILIIVSAVSITDIISSRVVKNSVERPRPCREISMSQQVNQRVRCGYSSSFTSSHAANHFGLALILISLLANGKRWVKWTLYSWAAIISFAQIYVGVHYPLDIIGGACLGLALISLYLKILGPTLERLADGVGDFVEANSMA